MYGEVPLVGFTVALPVLPPLHNSLAITLPVAVMEELARVTVTVEELHPASCTIIV